jgi:hypothetical protein
MDWKDKGNSLTEGFSCTSDTNPQWLDVEGIKKFIAPFVEVFVNGILEG